MHAIDSTIVRAHRACSRRKRGNQNREALGRSRGGFSTEIHLRTNAEGDPLTFDVTGGEAHEVKGDDALMELHDTNPDRLLRDNGYASVGIRNVLGASGPRARVGAAVNPYDRRALTIAPDTHGAVLIARASIGSSSSVDRNPLRAYCPSISRCYVSRQQRLGIQTANTA